MNFLIVFFLTSFLNNTISKKLEKDEEIVMLSQVIAHSCNIGYEMNKNLHLKSLNNIKIKNLKHLKSLIDEFENKQKNKNDTKKVKVVKTAKSSKINMENKHVDDNNSNIHTDSVGAAMVFEFANGQIIVLDSDEAIQAKDQVK